MIEVYLGIDIAKDKFDVAFQRNGKWKTKVFTNNTKGFEELTQWLERNKCHSIHACMEATGIYGEALADFLYKEETLVSVVNPAKIKGFGQSLLTRTKTDAADAKLIAQYCEKMNPDSYTPKPKHIKEMRFWVERLEALKRNKVQETNRLEAAPEAGKASLEKHIEFLEEEIKAVETKIQEVIASDEELKKQIELLETIPGIGKVTSAAFIAYTGNVNDFKNAKQLSAFMGLNPRQHQSGSSVHGRTRLSKVGNSQFRKAIFMPALTAKNRNPAFEDFCQRLADAGKCKMVIVGAVMRKLVHIMYGVLKHGKPFEANYKVSC